MKTRKLLLALLAVGVLTSAEEPAKDPFGDPVQPAKPDWRRSVSLSDIQELIGFFALKFIDQRTDLVTDAFLPGDFQTIQAGIPRIPHDMNESLHVMEFYVQQGETRWRYGFDLTLSTEFYPLPNANQNLSQIFQNRQLTQFRIWRVNQNITPASDAKRENVLIEVRPAAEAEQNAAGQPAKRRESK